MDFFTMSAMDDSSLNVGIHAIFNVVFVIIQYVNCLIMYMIIHIIVRWRYKIHSKISINGENPYPNKKDIMMMSRQKK